MNINPTNLSFTAKLSGQTYFKFNREARQSEEKETTFKEMVDSYDRQIATIQKQKESAIELDTFMRTNKEVQELIKKLPEEDTVEMVNNFCGHCTGEDSEVATDELMLLYISDTIGEHCGKDGTFVGIQNPDGGIDKKGIIDWLKDLLERVSE